MPRARHGARFLLFARNWDWSRRIRAQSELEHSGIDYLGSSPSSGGKSVRPAAHNFPVTLSGNGRDPRVIKLATVMEMLHTADARSRRHH